MYRVLLEYSKSVLGPSLAMIVIIGGCWLLFPSKGNLGRIVDAAKDNAMAPLVNADAFSRSRAQVPGTETTVTFPGIEAEPDSGARVHWARFHLANSGARRAKVLVGAWDFPVRNGELWLLKGDSPLRVDRIDRNQSPESKELNYRLPLFVVDVPPGGATYLARIMFHSSIAHSLYAWSPDAFADFVQKEYWAFGLVFGVILAIMGYHLFLFIIMREPGYLHYFFYLGILGWINFHFMGFHDVILPGLLAPWVMDMDVLYMPTIFYIVAVSFHRSLLNLRTEMPLGDRLSRWYIALALCSLPLPLWLGYDRGLFVQEINTLAFILITSIIAIIGNSLKVSYYRPFSWAWSILGLGTAFYFLSIFDQISIPFAMPYVMSGALCLSVLVLSFTNAERTKRLRTSLMETQLGMEAARVAQESFHHDEKIPGIRSWEHYRSADEAGGDFRGYYHVPERNWFFFYIGDVTGHGIGTSIISCAFSSALLTRITGPLKEQDIPMEEILTNMASGLNSLAMRTGARVEKLSSLAMGIIDLSTGDGRLLNAGHPGVYLIDQKGMPRGLPARGSLIGFRENPAFEIARFQFRPGDVLFLHTDGLTENTGPDGEVLSARMLRTALQTYGQQPSGLKDHLLGTAAALGTDQNPDDDVCFLIFRRDEAEHAA